MISQMLKCSLRPIGWLERIREECACYLPRQTRRTCEVCRNSRPDPPIIWYIIHLQLVPILRSNNSSMDSRFHVTVFVLQWPTSLVLASENTERRVVKGRAANPGYQR
jgi:hypothetical protein